ncbi:hypothetical protein B0H13DRAFT_2339995 [Mycena leptocephala]|nr:hypothetical protein B0H13DRAFT_2339995 [Mycena leptocephala]
MARMILSIVSFLWVFQALAGTCASLSLSLAVPKFTCASTHPAPFAGTRRAVPSDPACTKLIDRTTDSIFTVRSSLGGINPVTDVSDPRPLLTAQLALFNASAAANTLAISLDVTSLAPASADSTTLMLSGLQAAQSTLFEVNAFISLNNATTQKVAQANATLAQAISSAQQAADLNCTALASMAAV